MNLSSSRWCVMALVAYGTLACSDPVPLPAQGALNTTLQAASPPVPNKACPIGASKSYEVPTVVVTDPEHVLDGTNYNYWVVDGENRAAVRCAVKGGSTFTFNGSITLNGQGIELAGGTLDATHKGTATVTIKNSQLLSSPLISAPGACTIDASPGANGGRLQVKPGSMYAYFTCPSVESPPAESCGTYGYFVLENCEQ